jgi:hypothetical protein
MWARLERNEYRFVRELWRPKSFREREFGSKMDRERGDRMVLERETIIW